MFGKNTFRSRIQLFVLLFLPIHFLSFSIELAHSLLAPHTICPEHLEIVDAPKRLTANHDHTQVVFTTADEDQGAEGHEHCGILHTRRKNILLTPASCSVAHANSRFVIAIQPLVVAVFATEPRYRLAPKNSPPA